MTSNLIPLNYRPLSSMGFLYQYIAEKLMSNDQIEIELRMGNFKIENSKKQFQQKFYPVSKQAHLIVQYRSQKPIKLLDDFKKDFDSYKIQFDPNISFFQFQRCSEQLQNLVKSQYKKSEILIDFITNKKKRFTWNVMKNQLYENTKSNKENIDILHQGFEYRLSTSSENFIIVEDYKQIFQQHVVQFIRVKLRNHFYFQFLDYCLTKTLSIREQNITRKLIKFLQNNQGQNIKQQDVFAIFNCSKQKYVNEIEIEICDKDFLKQQIKKNDFAAFNSFIDRFFRNFEMLYLLDDNYVSKNFKSFCNDQNIPIRYPVIGSYLEKIIKQLIVIYKQKLDLKKLIKFFIEFSIMNKSEYDQRRQELVDQYPTLMQSNWLRNSRIIIAVLFLILVKVSQANLPVYNISCVQDNILPHFITIQNKLSHSTQCFLEIFFLSTFLIIFIFTLSHWMVKSNKGTLPIMMCIFFLVKTLSDVSLVLDKPEGAVWQEFSIGFIVKAEYFFYSNVDPFLGLLLIFLYYFITEEKSDFRVILLIGLGVYSFMFFLFELIFQLFFTFAIFSAVLTFIFAIFVGDKIEKNYFEKQDSDLNEEIVKVVE